MLGRLVAKLFSKESEDRGIYYYIRCTKCGEAIRVRVDRSSDLAQEFDDGGDYPSGYSASKGIVGKKCFRVINLTIRFDRRGNEAGRSIEGGEFITAEEFAQEQPPD